MRKRTFSLFTKNKQLASICKHMQKKKQLWINYPPSNQPQHPNQPPKKGHLHIWKEEIEMRWTFKKKRKTQSEKKNVLSLLQQKQTTSMKEKDVKKDNPQHHHQHLLTWKREKEEKRKRKKEERERRKEDIILPYTCLP